MKGWHVMRKQHHVGPLVASCYHVGATTAQKGVTWASALPSAEPWWTSLVCVAEPTRCCLAMTASGVQNARLQDLQRLTYYLTLVGLEHSACCQGLQPLQILIEPCWSASGMSPMPYMQALRLLQDPRGAALSCSFSCAECMLAFSQFKHCPNC